MVDTSTLLLTLIVMSSLSLAVFGFIYWQLRILCTEAQAYVKLKHQKAEAKAGKSYTFNKVFNDDDVLALTDKDSNIITRNNKFSFVDTGPMILNPQVSEPKPIGPENTTQQL